MGFFEFVWLFSLTVLLPFAIVKMSADVKRRRIEAEKEGAGVQDALTVRELKRIIRDTVEETNRPLAERVAALEAHLDMDISSSSHAFEDGFDDEVGADHRSKTLGRV